MAPLASPPSPLTIRSPEGVELELTLATPVPRIAAYMVDGAIVTAIMLLALLLYALGTPLPAWLGESASEWAEATQRGATSAGQEALAPLMGLLLVLTSFSEFLYFTFWELVTPGRSPGKYCMGLQVVSAQGGRVSAKAAAIRNLLRAADILPGAYLAGLATMVMSGKGQRLGDHAAGTVVVRTDRVERAPMFELPAGVQPLALSREQLARLGPRELLLARSTLRRVEEGERAPEEVSALLHKVAASLGLALGIDGTSQEDPRLFLQQVVRAGQFSAPGRG